MKHRNIFLLLAFWASFHFSYAQTIFQPAAEPPYIEVTGTAEREEIPDEIFIRIVFQERYSGKTKISIEEQEGKLKSAIKALGIDPSDLMLSDANADFVKINWKKKDVISSKEYILKVNSAAKVSQVYSELEKMEVFDASVVRVNHTKMDSLRKVVRVMAMKTANEKADYMLKAIGEQKGKAVIVRENEIFQQPMPYVQARMSNVLSGAEPSEDSEETSYQKIKIQMSVYVKYLIKQ